MTLLDFISLGATLLVGIGIVKIIQEVGREFFLILGILLIIMFITVWYIFGINDFTTTLGVVGIISFLIGGGEKLLK